MAKVNECGSEVPRVNDSVSDALLDDVDGLPNENEYERFDDQIVVIAYGCGR